MKFGIAGSQAHGTQLPLEVPPSIGAVAKIDQVYRIEYPPIRLNFIPHCVPVAPAEDSHMRA